MKAKTPLNLQVSLRWHDLKVSLNVYLWVNICTYESIAHSAFGLMGY